MYVPRAGRLPQRLLRVAGAAAEPAGERERGVEPSDHGGPRRVAGDLRGAAGARGAAGRGRGGVAAAGGAADAGAGPAGRDASETALHDPQGPGSGRGTGPGTAPLRGGKAEPGVGSGRTYVPTQEGFLYFGDDAGRVQPQGGGRAMSARQTVELVQSALEMALEQRAARGVVFHSDRGCQYTALAFTSAAPRPASSNQWGG